MSLVWSVFLGPQCHTRLQKQFNVCILSNILLQVCSKGIFLLTLLFKGNNDDSIFWLSVQHHGCLEGVFRVLNNSWPDLPLNYTGKILFLKKSDYIFKESFLWADSFYRLKCLYVCIFVCLFFCHTFSLCLRVFLPPLPKVQGPNFLDFLNPGGKVM